MARLLIVDDEPAVRRVMMVGLGKAGFEVSTADNGEMALSMLRTQSPDVLITDIEMPRMNGRQLCESINDEFPDRDFPIFILTSLADRDARAWSERLTDIYVLEKPVSMRLLVGKIQARLGSQA